jgi:hypothetical protein
LYYIIKNIKKNQLGLDKLILEFNYYWNIFIKKMKNSSRQKNSKPKTSSR